MSEDFGESIEFPSEVNGKTDNNKKIIMIVAIVLIVLCLCACCVLFVVPTLFGPTIETVFSDIIQELGMP